MAESNIKIRVSESGAERAASGLGKVDNSMIKMASSAMKFAGAYYAATRAIGQAAELAKLAAEAKNVEKAFIKLSDQPQEMMAKMKEASSGMISDMELMQKYNSAALLGLPLDRFDEMLNIARGASVATGQSMGHMLDSLVTGIGRGSKLMLDNLGILIDVEEANEEYAISIGKSVSQLSDEEIKLAFVNKALDTGNINIKKMGGVQKDSAIASDQFKASIDNLKVAMGELVGQGLDPAMKSSASFIDKIAIIVTAFANLTENLDIAEQKLAQQGAAMRSNAADVVPFLEGMSALENEFGEYHRSAEQIAEDNAKIAASLKAAAAASLGMQYLSEVTLGDLPVRFADVGDAIFDADGKMNIMANETFPNLAKSMQTPLEEFMKWRMGTEAFIGSSMSMYGGLTSAMSRYYSAKKSKEIADLRSSAAYLEADAEQRASMEEKINQDYAKQTIKIYRLEQLSSLASIAMNTAQAVMKAIDFAPVTMGQPWVALILAMGAAQAALVAATPPPAYAVGGIVPGSSYTGDRVRANVNSGEMILTAQQQRQLFEAANGRGGRGGITINVQGSLVTSIDEADRFAEIIAERAGLGFNRLVVQ